MRNQSFAASTSFTLAVLAAGTLGIVATPAEARQRAQAEEVTNIVGSGADNRQSAERKLCRTITRTGSNFKERVCLSRDQWRRVDDYLAKSF